MAFYIRESQLPLFACTTLVGYFALKKSATCACNVLKATCGTDSVRERVDRFSKDFYRGRESYLKTIFSTDSKEKKFVYIKDAYSAAKKSISLLAAAYVAYCFFINPITEAILEQEIRNTESQQNVTHTLFDQIVNYTEIWKQNSCFSQTLMWETHSLMSECLKPQIVVYKKDIPEFLKKCQEILNFNIGFNFFKVDLLQAYLQLAEETLKKSLLTFKKSIKKTQLLLETYLSQKYLGNWKQLGIGNVISFNYRFFCVALTVVAPNEVSAELTKDCDQYRPKIEEKYELLKNITEKFPSVKSFMLNCKGTFTNETNYTNFSLPNEFEDLIKSNNTERIAEYFFKNNGTDFTLGLDLSSATTEEKCNLNNAANLDTTEDQILNFWTIYQKTRLRVLESIQDKENLVFTNRKFDFWNSNSTSSRWLKNLKGYLVHDF